MANRRPQIEVSVEDTVVPLSSVGLPATNLGRWKSKRLAPSWLVASIKKHGLINPPVVRPATLPGDPPNKDYVLVTGEKRFLSLREIGVADIRVSIRTFASPEAAHAAAIAENLDREELTLHEEMQVVVRYAKATKRPPILIARDLNLPEKRVASYILAEKQMAPDLLRKFAQCTGRPVAILYIRAATQTPDHEEQRRLAQRFTSSPRLQRRSRRGSVVEKTLTMIRSAEVLKISSRVRKEVLEMLDPEVPLTARERTLCTLLLEWIAPLPGTGRREHLPLQSATKDAFANKGRRHEAALFSSTLDSETFEPRK